MSTPSLIHSVQPSAYGSALSRQEKEHILVGLAQNGDRHAYARLWDAYRKPLFGFFIQSVSSREEAEDLTSETLLAVFQNIGKFRGVATPSHLTSPTQINAQSSSKFSNTRIGDCTFKTYVFAIAANHLKQWIKRKSTRRETAETCLKSESSEDSGSAETASNFDYSDTGSDPLDSLLRREHLDSACFALVDVGMRSSEQFKALLLHYGCGLQHKDIALLLGTRKETINTRLQEGRLSLKANYSQKLAA